MTTFRAWLERWRRCGNFRQCACAIIDFGWALAHVLWVCRISVASVALGLLLFNYAPQARDLFRDVAGHLNGTKLEPSIPLNIVYAGGLWLTTLLFWSIPVHTMARWSIRLYVRFRPAGGLPAVSTANLPKRNQNLSCDQLWAAEPYWRRVFLITWVPRVLGALCFADLAYGLYLTTGESFDPTIVRTAQLTNTQLYITVVVLVLGVLAYALYVMRHRLFAFLNRRLRTTRFAGAPLGIPGVVGAIAASAILLLFFFFPQWSNYQGRVVLAPLVLGGWVPLLTFLTAQSYRCRIPVLTAITGVAIVFSWWHDEHLVRVLNQAPARDNPLTFDQAVETWERTNNCQGAPGNCPQPIVVAAAGGASRAAFTMASTLGLFMDATCVPDKPDDPAKAVPCGGHPVFSDRVFAISAVSGAAVGAAVFAAALREYQDFPTASISPCKAMPRFWWFWFRAEQPQSWRQCMQAILANDFLAPAVLGLAFRDQVPFANVLLEDRAAVLEDAWSTTFGSMVLPGLSRDDANARGMDASFDALLPRASGPWRPLLVLNGTSTASGRRIVTSHLPIGNGAHPLFSDSYEMRDLLTGANAGHKPAVSIRLSTAALDSARFPLISPPGVIRDRDGNFIDRVVDGGYFENYGITSATEIAQALHDKGLHPAILEITNDPISRRRIEQLDGNGDLKPLLPEDTEKLWLLDVSAPFLALYNTRSSRGDLAVMQTGQASHDSSNPIPFSQVTVYGEPVDGAANASSAQERPAKYKDVSMSWWMSKPMQEYIDWQLVDPTLSCGLQQKMLRRLCDWLKPLAGTDDGLAARCNSGLDKSFTARPQLPPGCPKS
jgi:hypothetical protein